MANRSPPSRGRGLKRFNPPWKQWLNKVASFAGAWIETGRRVRSARRSVASPPSRGRGLKLPYTQTHKLLTICRLLRGGVD